MYMCYITEVPLNSCILSLLCTPSLPPPCPFCRLFVTSLRSALSVSQRSSVLWSLCLACCIDFNVPDPIYVGLVVMDSPPCSFLTPSSFSLSGGLQGRKRAICPSVHHQQRRAFLLTSPGQCRSTQRGTTRVGTVGLATPYCCGHLVTKATSYTAVFGSTAVDVVWFLTNALGEEEDKLPSNGWQSSVTD